MLRPVEAELCELGSANTQMKLLSVEITREIYLEELGQPVGLSAMHALKKIANKSHGLKTKTLNTNIIICLNNITL